MRRAVRRCPTSRTATTDGQRRTVRGPAAGSAAVRPSGEVATAGRHRPHRTSAQPEPSAPVCVRPRSTRPAAGHHGGRVRRSAAVAAGRCAAWVRTPTGDVARVADTCCPQRGQRTGRVHWQNDQQPCPSSLRQKGRSGCVQAPVMEPVGGHLTAAGWHSAWTPRPPIRQRGRTQDRTPQAADGQSAGGFDSLQLPLLSSRPAGGRPPAALRPGDDTTVTGEPASPSTSGATKPHRPDEIRHPGQCPAVGIVVEAASVGGLG
jgi:hypothetical protein